VVSRFFPLSILGFVNEASCQGVSAS
jgi:hypothetical protein